MVRIKIVYFALILFLVCLTDINEAKGGRGGGGGGRGGGRRGGGSGRGLGGEAQCVGE